MLDWHLNLGPRPGLHDFTMYSQVQQVLIHVSWTRQFGTTIEYLIHAKVTIPKREHLP